jgi:hypothetical protein
MDWDDVSEYVSESVQEFLWGVTPKETLRRATLEIKSSVRKLDRDKAVLTQKEAKLIETLKRLAPRAHSTAELKPIAMSIARTRKSVQQINNMQFTMDGLQQQLLHSETSTTINSVLQATTQALAMVSGMNDPRNISNTLAQFQLQKFKQEESQSLLDDVQNEDEEVDAADMISQLQEEVGFELAFQLPSAQRKEANQEAAREDPELLELMDRLDILKRT